MTSDELCLLCPKLCSFACPVSEATAREALTPWGKVSLAALAAGDGPEPAAALAFAGCTGCLRCTQHCAHENDVPSLLYAARAGAVRSGTAPPVWGEIAARFAAVGHGEPQDLAAVHRALAEDDLLRAAAASPLREPRPGAGDALLFAGCDDLAAGARSARDALFAARRLGAPLQLAPALCCGLKLVEAGHPGAFAAHVARTRVALASASTLVFLQPGCARAVRERWAPGLPVEHVTTWLSRALAAVPARARPPPLAGEAVFHDPCELARGLSELTAPRALLSAALAGGVRDLARSGAEASCCGAGGLLPRTLPEVAARLAALRSEELAQAGVPVATASPACAAALGAEEVVSVVARWLESS